MINDLSIVECKTSGVGSRSRYYFKLIGADGQFICISAFFMKLNVMREMATDVALTMWHQKGIDSSMTPRVVGGEKLYTYTRYGAQENE